MFHGDFGVDIFFVLSGFLIGYILFKECEKYEGKVDVFGFYRGRFLRLWLPLFLASNLMAFGPRMVPFYGVRGPVDWH